MKVLRTLSIVFFVVYCSVPAWSDDRDYASWLTSLESVQDLGVIVVTPKRFPSEKNRSAERVAVYTQEEVGEFPARDLGEVLSYVPEVDVQSNGQLGQASSLSINGSRSREVLMMIDGIPFNTQLSGQANPAQISMDYIKQVEFIKGASSSVWGSSLGGVINVLTPDTGTSTRPEGTFKSSFAEFGTTKNSLALAGKAADLGYFLSGSYFNTDGISTVTDAQESEGFGKLSYALEGKGRIVGSFGYSGTTTFYGVPRESTINYQTYSARYGKLSWEMDETDNPYTISYKYNDQDIVTDILNDATRVAIFSTAGSNFYQGLSLESRREFFEDHLLVAGVDLDWHTIKSNQYLDTAKNISMQAPYVNYTLPWNNWDFISGLRYDRNQHFGEQVSPSLGAVHHFGGARRSLLRGKISRAFNAPPLLWIFNDDPSQFVGPNPDLQAETATVYEIGAESRVAPSLKLELNYYYADIKNGIATVFDNGVFVQRNFRKFQRQVVDVVVTREVGERWSIYGSGSFKDIRNKETGTMVRDQGVARQKFTFGAQYRHPDGFSAKLAGYYNRWSSSPDLEPNDRKPIFDLKLSREFKNVKEKMDLEIFLSIHNLTNSKYWSSITFPLPRRYFEGGFALKF